MNGLHYLYQWGLSDAFLDIKKTKIKSQNLFRIELNENVAYNEYVMFFINSDIGKAYRESLLTGSNIKRIPLGLIRLNIFLH